MRTIDLRGAGGGNVNYHNVEDTISDRHGLTLHRVPRAWRERFPEPTAFRATQAAGVELRFRAATRQIDLELRTGNNIGYNAAIGLYHGLRSVSVVTLPTPAYNGRVVLMDRDADIDDVLAAPWRIICPYGAVTTVRRLHLSQGAELLPASPRPVRWLAHGDSITQGAHALTPGATYVHLVADELGWDAINMGFGGSAWGDAPVAEYIASRSDWDILSIAIGTNTYGGEVESASDYERRYDRFLAIVREAHPDRPILCITPIWRKEDGPPEIRNRHGDPPSAYRQAINRVVRERQRADPHLGLLDGLALIGSEKGLTIDLVHPDSHGMTMIARGIVRALERMAPRSQPSTARCTP